VRGGGGGCIKELTEIVPSNYINSRTVDSPSVGQGQLDAFKGKAGRRVVPNQKWSCFSFFVVLVFVRYCLIVVSLVFICSWVVFCSGPWCLPLEGGRWGCLILLPVF